MNTQQKQLFSERIESGLMILWGITLLLFPLAITTYTTDAFILPKLLLVGLVTLLSLIAWGVQMLLQGQVRLRRTPLDVPVVLFAIALILSSIFSINRLDSLVATAEVVLSVLSYFVLVNVFRERKVAFLLLSSLVTGIAVATVLAILSHFGIYVLPFAVTKTTTFNTLGTAMEYAVFSIILLPLALYFVYPLLKKRADARVGVFAVAALILIAGLAVAGQQLMTVQKPALLPFDTGFQTAFAAISQDSGRVLQTFFFGEGYGTFASVFSRFHNAAFNANSMWYLAFNNSSSYILELLATTGLVGTLSYLFLLYRSLLPMAKKKANPFYLSLVIAFVVSLLLPFSLLEIMLLFVLLAGFSLAQREVHPSAYFDVELKLVALKKGVLSFTTLEGQAAGKPDMHPTPFVGFAVLLVVALVFGYYGTAYAMSDATFQQSLLAANTNNGTQTYRLQAQAISTFPYRSDYYRIFSQTNIALANSLLSLTSGKASPSATAQQTAYALIQQAITTARQATTLAPDSVPAWQNLSSIYRALIGVGQNAQDFAIQAAQQATVLDPVNPQEYLNLGGLYYQLGQYDNAIRMFQQAIALKGDYANAYYNLAHAYEQKGDLQSALTQLQTVETLVASDKTNADKIAAEIKDLQAKIGTGSSAQQQQQQGNAQQQQQLSLPQANQLPSQKEQLPLLSPTPSK